MSAADRYGPAAVAVIGMAGRFPGAADVAELWRNLAAGVESVRYFSRQELAAAGVPRSALDHPELVPAGALLDGPDLFDARFFGYSPREAELLDPQQRLFLESCWQALESAGYDAERCPGAIAVYGGATMSSYLFHLGDDPWRAALAGSAAGAGNAPDFFATRVAYKMNLRGPAYTVATACSTGLVAVHLACQALLSYETDMALAGAASVRVPHVGGYIYQESGILSPDGHTRPFDARARGTLFGHGVGAVVLKRLDDALADGDPVLAVVRATATNNDGAAKAGFTAPSLLAQSAVIREALAAAAVEPESIGLVEAHGTGTALGDPIEVTALTRAFDTARRGYCALGSIKSNLGHLDAAAGIAGFVKAVLALHHRAIPPSLNFERPNPEIDFAGSPFFVAAEGRDWPADGGPRRAGVSSFGFGGTNAHAVLEEAPEAAPAAPSRPYQLLVLSARTADALGAAATNLAAALAPGPPAPDLADAAHTLALGRRVFEHRRAVIARDAGEAARRLGDGAGSITGRCATQATPVTFLFPGEGSLHPGAGRELYDREPTYRRWIDAAADALGEAPGLAFRELLDAPPADPEAAERPAATRSARPALFALQHALLRLWDEWGVRPVATGGVGGGELAAACAAGAIGFEDALSVAAALGAAPAARVPPDAPGALREALGRARLRPPRVPWIRRDGEVGAERATDLEWWLGWLTATDPAGDLELPRADPGSALLVVGAVRSVELPAAGGRAVAASLAAAGGSATDTEAIAEALGRLWVAGVDVDWQGYRAHERRHRVALPTYPFERRSYWAAPTAPMGSASEEPIGGEPEREVRASREPAPATVAATSDRPRHRRPELPTPFAPAEGTTEAAIAELLAEALGVEPVGRDDDFFALGGDSLIATRVLTDLRDRLGLKIGLDRLFAAPTVAGLAAAGEAPPEPPAAPEAGTSEPAREEIPRADLSSDLPPSFAQQRLWFLHQLEPASAAYNLPGALDMDGRLEVAALAAALAALFARHQALRTRLPAHDGRAVQRIDPPRPVPLPLIDLSALDRDSANDLTETLLAAAAGRPFDLERGPLASALLVRVAPERHRFLLVAHHTVSDGWSWGVIGSELVALYGEAAGGPGAALPEPGVGYADYAVWHRDWVEREVAGPQLAWWRERLTPLPPPLELPADRPRREQPRHRGVTLPFRLPDGTGEAVVRLARERGATPFGVLVAAFAALLARISHQRDLAIGTPVANRPLRALESVVGFFANTLVLRLDAGADPAFADLVARAREAAAGAFAHQDLPFERLVDELRPERRLDVSPLFQVAFALQRAPIGEARVPGLTLSPVDVDTGAAMFDLTLSVMERGGVPAEGTLQVDRDLFDRATGERLAGWYRRLLAAAVAAPATRLSRLPLLDDAELRQLLASGARRSPAVAAAAPGADGLHRLFAARATAAPDAVALSFEDARISYGELFRRADRLARRLRRLGVAPDRRVGLALERGPELVAGVLGVLAAGGAYVPLDPSYPEERLRFLLEDSGIAALVTEPTVLDRLPPSPAPVVLAGAAGEPDEAAPGPAGSGRGDPDPAAWPAVPSQALAYVIYTSGSTGRPKGVGVSHANVARLLAATGEWFGFGESDVWTLFHSYAFDFSVWELWGALAYGGRLAVVPYWTSRSPQELAGLLRRERVTVLNQTPSAFRQLVAATSGERFDALREVVFGGEALEPSALAPFVADHWPGRDRAGRPRLVNMYGITETTVHVTYRPLDRADVAAAARSPIGVPIPDLSLHLAGPALEPVPEGVPGELLVGGEGLARGYLGRPALTARRFVPDPFGARPGARLYRSGDLGRRRPGGGVEYLGRIDQQVKIRGHRIELGEIEAALAAVAGVREAAVIARAERPGEPRLIAYAVAGEPAPEQEELRAALAATLPAYMVPAAFVLLDALPLTAHGKLDRAALPAPEIGGSTAGAGELPETAAERALARIWADVLGVDRVGAGDNFFALGGDSILSIQVVARANAEGLRLTPRDLFERQTVAELARALGAAEAAVGIVGAEQGPVTGTAPLTAIQRWFFEVVEATRPAAPGPSGEPRRWNPAHWNQGLVLALRRPLSRPALALAVERLVAHHDALRLRFERSPAGGERGWSQRLAAPEEAAAGGAPLTEIDLGALPREVRAAARERTLAAAQASLDFAGGPLVRFILLTGAGTGDRLLAIAHHLVVDGVSWRLLLTDLEACYAAIEAGREPALPPKTTSWRAWCEALAEAAGSADAGELSYWLTEAGRPAPPLPRDGEPRPAGTGAGVEGAARRHRVELSEADTRELLGPAAETLSASAEELLLGALVAALDRWTGGAALRLDLEGHGREESLVAGADLSRTAGWFTALYPLFVPAAAPGESSGDLRSGAAAALRRVKEALRAVPRRGAGYGLLRRLDPDAGVRLDGAEPDLAFNYLGRLDAGRAAGAVLAPTAEDPGPLRDSSAPRRHLLEVDVSVLGGRLRWGWSFEPRAHRPETVAALAAGARTALGALLALARGAGRVAEVLAPSDFPLAAIDRGGLDRVLAAAAMQRARLADLHAPTPVQEGMLFHALLSPGSGVYHEQLVCELEGDLDPDAFAEAWRGALARRDALRTAVVRRGLERPLLMVLEGPTLTPERLDWRGAGDRTHRRLEGLLAADRARGLDLERAPMARLTLIRTGERRWCFLWSFHHLVLDGWSASAVLKDVFDLYRARRRGESTSLAPAAPFAGYLRWLAGRDLESAESFWRETLGDLAAPTPLGIDRPRRGAGGSGLRGDLRTRLPAAVSAALGRFARHRRLTTSTLVHGAWALLLARYAGGRDVVFGTTVAGRPADLPGVETMAGMFINSLPLRVAVDPERPLTDWFHDLQESLQALAPHEHTPLARIQAQTAVPVGEPLFESLVVFENYPVDASLRDLGGELELLDARFVERADTPLVLVASPGEELGLRAGWELDRIDRSAAARLLGHLSELLVAVVEKPDSRLGELVPWSAAERHQVVAEWNDPTAVYDGEGLLHRLFERSTGRVPDAVAVVAGGSHLSYRELDRRSAALAGRLGRLGIGPDDRVGAAFGRSPELLIGLLGILRAGAAYVPLDPELPARRLELILDDTGVGVVVAEPALAVRIAGSGRTPVTVGGAAGETAGDTAGSRQPSPAVDPDHLAYVLHTSGSTGRPKGVMIPHRGVVHRLAFAPAAGHLRPGDRFLHKASIGFDVSLLELFLPLSAGGTVVMARPGGHQDPAHLAELMARERVQQAIFPPSLLGPLLDAAAIDDCAALHSLASSAEELPVALQRRFHEALPGAVLYNRYGPTEASIAATSQRTDPDHAEARVPIGRPIARAAVHVVDRDLQAVGIAVTGELAIGGPGLARGYLGRPAATAAAFVPNPFARRPGERLYLTGDRARHRPDGAIEFLGRADHQVKIRGVRVELGEVEAALAHQPGVARAVAMVREDRPGVRRLVAYAVPAAPAAELDPAALRRSLAETLPDAMVPAAVVALAELPLTANGKVDRDALPAPGAGRETAGGEYVAPRNPAEAALAEIWEAVLGLERVGVEDDFFALGGDSILSLRVVSRAQEAGFELSVRRLFEARTVADVAAGLDGSPAAVTPAAAEAAEAASAAAGEPTIDVDVSPEGLEAIFDQLAGALESEGDR